MAEEVSFPCSYAQERLWFLEQLQPGTPAYNLPMALRLRGSLCLPAMETALQVLINRHESLRTRIIASDTGPLQCISRNRELQLPVTRLACEDGDCEAALIELIKRRSNELFDLEHGPLFRAELLSVSERDNTLVLAMHHIISDGWSMDLLLKELAEAYNSIVAGSKPDFADLPIQYADYAVWQRHWLQGGELERQISFWRERLRGAPPLLNLPLEHVRPQHHTASGGAVPILIDTDVAQAVRAIAKRAGATVFMVLMAATALLLQRYTGQNDIVIGCANAGRNRPELESLIGFFINMLVLRTSLEGDPTFEGLVSRVRDTSIGAFAHQDLPFERLVHELAPPRIPNVSPFFQVLFLLQSTGKPNQLFSGLYFESVDTGLQAAKTDLTFAFNDSSESLSGVIGYNAEIFEPDTITRMSLDLQSILKGVARCPQSKISHLKIHSEDEIRHSAALRGQLAPSMTPQCIHHLFEAQAQVRPDAVALAFADRRMTYRELDVSAERIASWLQKQGVGPEAVVAVETASSFETIAALLGVLKAGGAYLPIDPSLPAERISFMLEDSKAALFLTQLRLAGLRLVEGRRACDYSSPGNPAYVIYTSGSTGKPKGVMLEHRNLTPLLEYYRTVYGAGSTDRALHCTSLSFDVSVAEVFGILCAGGTLVVPDHDVRNPNDFFETARNERISIIWAAPSWLSALLNNASDVSIPSLRILSLIGETCSPALAQRCTDIGDVRIDNAYGPTEAAVFCTREEYAGQSEIFPIGRALAFVDAYILDELLRPVPPGVEGDLYIGGPGLARGYVFRPGLTAARFVANPFATGSRLYKTGDRCRIKADGSLYFLGRADRQVKIRGQRVELEEIEATLRGCVEVAACAVTAEIDSLADGRLIAYIVLNAKYAKADSRKCVQSIRETLVAKLPAYMLPSALFVVQKLPVNASGKVDVAKLKSGNLLPESTLHVPPQNATQGALLEIWRSAIGVANLGVNDDFFEVGGHSLIAVSVISRINAVFGIMLRVGVLFTYRTIADLSCAIDEAREQAGHPASPLIELNISDGDTPLVCFHGAGGSALCYRELAQRLGSDCPILGVEAQGLSGVGIPSCDINEMARRYADAIASRVGRRSVILLGWSMGAFLAVETGRRLQEQGCSVVAIASIYTPNVPPVPDEYSDHAVITAFARENGLDYDLCHEALVSEQQDATRDALRRSFDVFRSNVAALSGYTPSPVSTALAIFRTVDHPYPPELASDRSLGWSNLAHKDVAIFDVPGDHDTILHPPCVDVLAAKIADYVVSLRSLRC